MVCFTNFNFRSSLTHFSNRIKFIQSHKLQRFIFYIFYSQVSVVDELGIPVKFVGVGEGVEDLQPFDAEAFVNAIFP